MKANNRPDKGVRATSRKRKRRNIIRRYFFLAAAFSEC